MKYLTDVRCEIFAIWRMCQLLICLYVTKGQPYCHILFKDDDSGDCPCSHILKRVLFFSNHHQDGGDGAVAAL